MCWPRGFSIQVQKSLQALGKASGERGEVPLEAFDALLAMPIASNTSMVLLSPFQLFAISQWRYVRVRLLRELLLLAYWDYVQWMSVCVCDGVYAELNSHRSHRMARV